MDFLSELEASVPALRRYARALLRDRDSADDLVHDCIVRALSRRHLWRPRGTVRAWLFTIMHHLHANHRRREAGAPRHLPLDDADLPPVPGRPADQGDRLALRDLGDALLLLAPEQREALLLIALEGLSYEEVARVQGVAVGTVMSRLSRARDRLRALTEGEDAPPVLRRIK